MLIPLLQNMALIVAISLLFQYMSSTIDKHTTHTQIFSGLLFGLVGLIGMLTPMRMEPGLIYDSRSIILAAGGVFGGPVVATIAACICAVYRLYLGGPGALAGTMVIVEAAGVSTVYYLLVKAGKIKQNTVSLLVLGLTVHVLMLVAQFLIPNRGWASVIPRIAPVVLTAYPAAFLLVCKIFTDTNERRLEQESLKESEARYRSLFDDNRAIMLLIDPADGHIVDANPAAERFYGWTQEQLKSMRVGQINILGDESVQALIDNAAFMQQSKSIYKNRTAKNEIRDVEVYTGPVRFGGRTLLHSIVQDVTDREAVLRERSMLYNAIDRSFNEVFIFDAESLHFSYASQGAVENTGYSMEALQGMTVFDLNGGVPEQELRRFLDDLRSGIKKSVLYRTVGLRANGSSYPVEVRLQMYDSGQERVFLAIAEDITGRLAAEEKILALNRELEQRVADRTEMLTQANRELEAFSYSVSHDLRAPLRAIHGFGDLLGEKLKGSLDAESRHYLDRIHSGIDRMGRLIDDLLRLSRVGRQQLDVRPVDLATLAREAVDGLRSIEPARKVQISIPAALPASGDPNLLQVVMENLIGNAWKFSSGREEARIEVGKLQSTGDSDTVGPSDTAAEPVWYVSDNGVGFDPAYTEQLFVPFHRLHSEREFPGTGIGLSIVHRVITRHGGTIWAESSPGNGARFCFTLGGHNGVILP